MATTTGSSSSISRSRVLQFACLLAAAICLLGVRSAFADDDCKPAAPSPGSQCRTDTQCCSGLVCQLRGTARTCQPGCRIGGVFYANGAPNPANICQSCQPSSSTRSWTNRANGSACTDNNACTINDTCSWGVCRGTARTCNDNNVCTTDTCNPASGCVFTNNTNACSDGNTCTVGDICGGGTCHPGTGTLDCNDHNPCTTDTCTPAAGCVFTSNTNACTDGNACTVGDTCGGGACHPGAQVVCGARDQCHAAGVCDPSSGFCSDPPVADGSACSDGNACTQADTCLGGVCTGLNPVVCTALDQCHVAGTCNTSTGACSNANATDGTGCNDGNGCTQPDTCQTGVCTTGAGNPCLNGGTCASASGGGYACFCPTGATGVNCETCANGYTECAGSCTNTQGDVANCGQCGTACAAGEVCSAGNCVFPVPAQLAINLPDGFSPVPGGSAAQPFSISVVDATGQNTGITGDFVTISPGGQVIPGQCTLSTGTCPPPNYMFGPFCCEPDTYAFTISGCEPHQLTVNGTATFTGCIFTGPSGAAVSGAILRAFDSHYGFSVTRSFNISTGGCTAQKYSFLVSTRGFGCSRSGPPPTSSFDPLSCASPSAPACCASGGCQPDNYNVQSGQSGIYNPVPANVLLYSPQGCDPVHQPQNCTLAHPSCFILCFSNDPSCVSPFPPCQAEYPARGFGVPYNGNCSTRIDDSHFAECLLDAQWPTYHASDGTAQQGTISAGSGDCTVSVGAPTGDIVVVGTLGDHWQVKSHGPGYSSCVGVGGPNGDGVQPPDCSELEISNPSVVAGRPSCSDGLACPSFSTAQGNGSATDVYTVYCVP